MKIIIKDREYDPQSATTATLWDLCELRSETGLSLAQVQDRLAELSQLPEAEQAAGIFESGRLEALMALIWLLRRRAGEQLTLEQATNDFAVADLRITADDDEPGDGAPKDDAVA
jgi:hypothetical protein